jgi:hypothetical protein
MRHFCSPMYSRRAVSRLLRIVLTVTLVAASSFVHADQEEPETRQTSIWKSVLSRMPRTWKDARRVEVYWVSDREMDRLVAEQEDEDQQQGEDSTIQGFYDRARDARSPASITIRANLSRDEATFVLSHEYAHMVWDEVMSRRQRMEYRRIWEDQRRSRRLVSRYATESAEEGFAEAVASYLLQPERLNRRDEYSYRFVQDLIREADEAEDRDAVDSRS